MPLHQSTDLRVSRKKFDREIAEFRALGDQYRPRGWFLVHAEYPRVLVLLASPKLTPSAIVMGVLFDYTNYDASPPSVRLVHPFTAEPYKLSELPTQLVRALPDQHVQVQGMPGGIQQVPMQVQQPLMQAHEPNIPFLCIAGVREYHEHPAHCGDLWELHRAGGAGRLARLLEIISRYGLEPINGFAMQLLPKIVGFSFGAPPV
jgi:hypothetical protein